MPAVTVQFDPVADLDGLFRPACASQFHRCEATRIPGDGVAVLVGDVDVVADMRILEPDLPDYALDGLWIVGVEFCRIGMVCAAFPGKESGLRSCRASNL